MQSLRGEDSPKVLHENPAIKSFQAESLTSSESSVKVSFRCSVPHDFAFKPETADIFELGESRSRVLQAAKR